MRGEPLEPWPVAGCVQEVRWPSGPPLLRWPDAHGPALLHQRRYAPARRVAFHPNACTLCTPSAPAVHPLCTRCAPAVHPLCTHLRPRSADTCPRRPSHSSQLLRLRHSPPPPPPRARPACLLRSHRVAGEGCSLTGCSLWRVGLHPACRAAHRPSRRKRGLGSAAAPQPWLPALETVALGCP